MDVCADLERENFISRSRLIVISSGYVYNNANQRKTERWAEHNVGLKSPTAQEYTRTYT